MCIGIENCELTDRINNCGRGAETFGGHKVAHCEGDERGIDFNGGNV